MNNPTNSPFRTTNFYLAAFLIAHGINLSGCDRNDGGRATFVFQSSDELTQRVNEFTFGGAAMVSVFAFINATKRLKSVIYDGV